MDPKALEDLLKKQPDVHFVAVESDGKHYMLTLVSDVFLELPKVKRQLWVYALLQDLIVSGQLHAIQMQTWTKAEWKNMSGEKSG